ncbi:hypothetical protein LINGRAPRIM_LOCUS1330, partial [Linum grandiflorum]
VYKTFASIMQYAGSQGNGGHLHHLSIVIGYGGHGVRVAFSTFAASIVANRHHQSLRTLELADCRLDSLTSTGFKLLTTLQLSDCTLKDLDDPFADFPSLKSLKLIACTSRALKVSDGFPTLNVPILDQAEIGLGWVGLLQFMNGDIWTEEANRAFIDLLCCLHNAKSLVLSLGYNSTRYDFPLAAMKSLMDPEASPFTRLKTLAILYREKPPLVPDQVIRYLFNGSPSSEDRTLLFEKVQDIFE